MADIDEDDDTACTRCHGEGTIPCDTCRGRGGRNVHRLRPTSFDLREGKEGLEWEACPTCDGSRREVCPECFGGELAWEAPLGRREKRRAGQVRAFTVEQAIVLLFTARTSRLRRGPLRPEAVSACIRQPVQNFCRFTLAMVGAMAVLAPCAQAVSLSVGAPVQGAAGWMRAAGHYDSGAAEPTFQVVAHCGPESSDMEVIYGIHVAAAGGALWLDLPGTPDRLGPADSACEVPQLSLQMIVDTKVVASAVLPRREGGSTSLPAAALAPATPLSKPEPRFQLKGQKYASPTGGRTEAGVAMSLGSHMSVQLNYARTAQVPMMGFANDNGILARLRFGF